MKRIAEHEDCVGCSACMSVCPQHCISMDRDNEGFLYPVIDEMSCIHCDLCGTVCPSLSKESRNEVLRSYVAINKDAAKRAGSSSGGIFPLLAEEIIRQSGVVYGVAMTPDCRRAEYTEVTVLENLDKLYGSKYLQAEIDGIYLNVKENLMSGKKVLFCGTPCHVNGLKLFLKRDYSNLWTIDFICHGVPSPVLWKKYVSHIEKKRNAKVTKVNFRDKKRGWTTYGIRVTDETKKEFYQSKNVNPYLQIFFGDVCLRPSCYRCHAKDYRQSDITLGDFWGINQVYPELNDETGASVLVVRTDKGAQIVDLIRDRMILQAVDYSIIVEHNSAEKYSVDKPVERDTFFQDMLKLSFSDLEKKYVKISMKLRIRDKLDSYGFLRVLTHKILD